MGLFMKKIPVYLSLFACISLLMPAVSDAGSIRKCKDAKGQWHYGTHAAKECERSNIIEFSPGKVKKKVTKGAPTKDELTERQEEKRKLESEKTRKAKQKEQDKILTQSYAQEEDLIYEKNRKLKDLQATIDAGKSTLASLRAVLNRAEKNAEEEEASGKKVSKNTQKTLVRARRQVGRHEASLVEKRKEFDEMTAYYDDAVMRYREMKSRKKR